MGSLRGLLGFGSAARGPRGGRCDIVAVRRSATAVGLAGLMVLAGCSPTFDWREARPADGLTLLFPCRPGEATRVVQIAGARETMSLWSCNAGELTFAVSRVDASEPARVGPLMAALREALVANVSASAPQVVAAAVPGATEHPLAQRLVLRGQRADGTPLEVQGQFFSHGLRVFQATVVGSRLDPQVLDLFFSSLKFGP